MGGSDLDRANVFSLLFFSFLSRILSIGKKRGFIASDLGDVCYIFCVLINILDTITPKTGSTT